MSIQDIQQKPKKKHRKLLITLLSIAALFILIIVLAAIDASNDNDTATASASASSAGVAGIPPKPDAAHTAAYIAALKAIDPAIASEKSEDMLVTRGRDTCSSIYNFPQDKAKQADETNRRFTSPQHPNGYGIDKAAKIVDAAHTNICPSY